MIQSIRCPDAPGGQTEPPPEPDPVDPPEPEPEPSPGPSTGGAPAHGHRGHDRDNDRDRDRDRNRGRGRDHGPATGGVRGVAPTGGVAGKVGLAPIVAETDGVGLQP